VSSGYGHLVPAAQIRFGVTDEADSTAFLLRPSIRQSPDENAAIEVETLENGCLRVAVTIGASKDFWVVNLLSLDVELRSGGMKFRGDLVRVRCRFGRLEVVQWLNGRCFTWEEKGVVVESAQILPSLRLDSSEAGGRPTSRKGLAIRWPD
jgi:hypothetical protein